MKPITLRLGETNELKFKLQLQGITSNPQETKPRIRFLVTEKNHEDSGVLIPVSKDKEKEGFVAVVINGDPKYYDAEKLYEGNIEVLIGNRYFNAAKYDINFMKEMKVEVESIIVNNQNLLTEDNDKEEKIVVSSELVSEEKTSDELPTQKGVELGSKFIKSSFEKPSEEAGSVKDKVRKMMAEKLGMKQTDPRLEKLIETAYKKYQKETKD